MSRIIPQGIVLSTVQAAAGTTHFPNTPSSRTSTRNPAPERVPHPCFPHEAFPPGVHPPDIPRADFSRKPRRQGVVPAKKHDGEGPFADRGRIRQETLHPGDGTLDHSPVFPPKRGRNCVREQRAGPL